MRIALAIALILGCAFAADLNRAAIGPDDTVTIMALNVDEISKAWRIGPTGELNLPLVGRLNAAGMTAEQLEKAIARPPEGVRARSRSHRLRLRFQEPPHHRFRAPWKARHPATGKAHPAVRGSGASRWREGPRFHRYAQPRHRERHYTRFRRRNVPGRQVQRSRTAPAGCAARQRRLRQRRSPRFRHHHRFPGQAPPAGFRGR